jgi:hypothetical protein
LRVGSIVRGYRVKPTPKVGSTFLHPCAVGAEESRAHRDEVVPDTHIAATSQSFLGGFDMA